MKRNMLNKMKKIINGIEVTKEEHELYNGFMEFERVENIDFIPSYMTDDITEFYIQKLRKQKQKQKSRYYV